MAGPSLSFLSFVSSLYGWLLSLSLLHLIGFGLGRRRTSISIASSTPSRRIHSCFTIFRSTAANSPLKVLLQAAPPPDILLPSLLPLLILSVISFFLALVDLLFLHVGANAPSVSLVLPLVATLFLGYSASAPDVAACFTSSRVPSLLPSV